VQQGQLSLQQHVGAAFWQQQVPCALSGAASVVTAIARIVTNIGMIRFISSLLHRIHGELGTRDG
jgi:hypothetical protein